jgi:hypothetical protein
MGVCDLVACWLDVGRKKKGKSETENDLRYLAECKMAMTSPACNYYLQPPS